MHDILLVHVLESLKNLLYDSSDDSFVKSGTLKIFYLSVKWASTQHFLNDIVRLFVLENVKDTNNIRVTGLVAQNIELVSCKCLMCTSTMLDLIQLFERKYFRFISTIL